MIKLDKAIQGKKSAVTLAGIRLGAFYAQCLLGTLAQAKNEGWVHLDPEEIVCQSPLSSILSVKLLAWDPEPVSKDCQAAYQQNCQAIQRANTPFEVSHDYIFFERQLRGSSKGYLLGDPERNAHVYHLELQSRDIGWAKEKAIDDKTPLAGERARLAVRALDRSEIQTLFVQRFGSLGTAWASSSSTWRTLWSSKS